MRLTSKARRIRFGLAAVALLLVFIAVAFVSVVERSMQNAPTAPEARVTTTPRLPPPPADPQMALLGSDSSISAQPHALVLVATEPGPSSRLGRASIGTDSRNPQTYAAGAVFANGTVLEEIYADYVVLSRDGKRFVLTVAGATPDLSARHRSLSIASDALLVGGDESVKKPLDHVPTSREDLSYAIRAEPFFEHDTFAGLRILPGIDSTRLAILDLKSGDIVRVIDGKTVRSADEAWQTLDDAISSRTPIVIAIERDGALMSMSLDGSRLSAHEDQALSMETLPPSPGL